ncbi:MULTISPECIES: FAD-binding protein [unclassified Mesorhizobium]|uniref:FAD-binding protein n=1 Tax=unclassified Mesorhizobium TaxID=325217 RepID=UPI0010922EBD|nr:MULTISPECIES: FAD-binding protein [unclassified Mesorhizobium]TGQ40552.1 FAD-binding protein [Mesorhizobium sp. M4B.F.Ca.ET.214.01.1.1]TGQ60609.1 FAD-binding protein [Mesorhizobium sp. M4B.F.Ca.ET.211.01.1.1]TGU36477.1 FAD-binding protein [Mesorhizobium sp. M4B.F.Ca.ET.150.01.1.1]TIX15201.1 MAG: FAD-binding protein [Mesorhizobium sp.]
MKTDVIVVGAELEALVAALFLSTKGVGVRLLMPGAGSLHYSAGGLGLFNSPLSDDPLQITSQLKSGHPYSKIAGVDLQAAVRWFLECLANTGNPWVCSQTNAAAVTISGTPAAVYAYPSSLALADDVMGKNVAVVALSEYADFMPHLLAEGLSDKARSLKIIDVRSPASGDSVRQAQALDRGCDVFFDGVRRGLPSGTECVVFPAILGLERHRQVFENAQTTLGTAVREIATLPPSVFGIRLYRLLLSALQLAGANIHQNVRDLRAVYVDDQCRSLVDDKNNEYYASQFIAACGGVMLGGLQVGPENIANEPTFGLDVIQTRPLDVRSPGLVQHALHTLGVETDTSLRGTREGTCIKNVYVTGTLLANWDPVRELSLEGVAVATALKAANLAREGVLSGT